MRKLMWFSIGFIAACALGIYLSYGIWLLIAAGFCLPCAIALLIGESKLRKQSGIAVLGCFFCFLWLFVYDGVYLSDAREADGKQDVFSVEIVDYSYDYGYGTVTEGKLSIGNKTYRVCVYGDAGSRYEPGDHLEGKFSLQYTAAGGAEKETYHQGKGIFLLAYSTGDISVTAGEPQPWEYLGARLCHYITGVIDSVFPQDAVGFARALLLGDTSLLTYEQDNAFQISGLRHIVAVSGLHVSILFSLVYLLAGKRRLLTALLGIPVLFLFASVAGFTPSITRACIMQTLMILGLLLNREYDPPTALAFAVLVMVAVNPQAITSVSLQLSASCMAGIFLFSGRISNYFLDEKRLKRIWKKKVRYRITRWFWGSVSVTLGAMVTTVPLCAWYFGCVSLVSILSNLLTLWVISFIFYGIMAACIAGSIFIGAGELIAWLVAWPIRYVLLSAKLFSSIPYAAVYVSSVYIVAWLIFCYILLAVFLCSKDKKPALFALCIFLTLIASIGFSRLENSVKNYRITMLDVGQGQCILLETRDRRYLVDCGGDTAAIAADRAADHLMSMGISHLDGIILTHFDNDHAAGIPLLLKRISVDTLYLPDVEDEGMVRQQILEECSHILYWIQPDKVFSIPEGNITVFSASADKRDNESSLCVLFQPEKCDILITGDRSATGERALLAQTELPDLEILVVGHHGSDDAAGADLLAATRPELALISVGADNPFGHPTPQTLLKLQTFGCQVLRTDMDGTIRIGG